ncbi:MAG: sulfotransferase domain-containing protein [Saonia sp.]
MKKNLLHYGLQRSGTNYLENLLKKNFQVNILNSNEDRAHPLQKHFRLYDEKNLIPEPQYDNNLFFSHFWEYLESLEIEQRIDGIIIISKDPYSWFLSYMNWRANCDWPEAEHHYAQEYNLFYKKWLSFSEQDDRIHFVRYVDLLSNPSDELKIIKKKYKLSLNLITKLGGVKSSFKKVAHSKSFSNKRVDYYLNKGFLSDYDNDSLEKINKIVEPELLKSMNYERIKN